MFSTKEFSLLLTITCMSKNAFFPYSISCREGMLRLAVLLLNRQNTNNFNFKQTINKKGLKYPMSTNMGQEIP